MPVFDALVSPCSLVSGQVSVSAVPHLPKIAFRVRSPAQVRGLCQYARVFPRRDGVGPTKVRAQCAYIFRLVSFVCNHCRGGGAVARGELCAWGICQSLYDWLGASMYFAAALLIFLYADLVPVFATVPLSHTRAAYLALSPAQVRGPSGLARILTRGDGVLQARARARNYAAAFLSGYVVAAVFVVLHGS